MSERREPAATARGEAVARGRTCLKAGDHGGALALAEQALAEFGEHPDTLLLAGEVRFSLGDFAGADKLARRSSALYPEDLGGPMLRCRALLAQGRTGDARDLALDLADKEVRLDAHIEILVAVLCGCLEPGAAYRLCRRSLRLNPESAAAHRRLALTCRLLGKTEEALNAAGTVLRFDPHDFEMIAFRSALHRATPADNHVSELEALLASGRLGPIATARVAYALASEYEDLGRYRQAFAAVRRGACAKRQTLRYDLEDELLTLRLLEEHHDNAALRAPGTGYATTEPIFVLGLPRTGSTLVERILASHSEVYAAGELLHLSAAMMDEVRKRGVLRNRLDLVRRSIAIDPAAIGANYLRRTRPFTGHTPRFIDKRPLNYLSVGIIHRALPDATVIHVRRNPMDTCFAIYKFLFNDAYPWSYDLDEIARYYVAYRRLMNHWRQCLPGRIVEVAYEDIVADLESETRRLLAAVQLDWEPGCLAFHRNDAAAYTGSAHQVRRPLYTESIGQWRRHGKELRALARALEAAGIDPYVP